MYRAIIPAGAKLTDSKAMEGAVRGFYHGADGIRGHANLVAVEAQKGTAVAAMGVASMIVGQYYMTQINAELGVISDGISQIQNFQDNEYRSRVFSLVAHVKKIADFQTEILENDELRLSKIAQLDSLEEECTKLLGQANLTLAGFAKKSGLNYDGYEKALTACVALLAAFPACASPGTRLFIWASTLLSVISTSLVSSEIASAGSIPI